MQNFELDDIDRSILREVERDGRATYLELSQRVALSPNATAERLRRLMRGPIVGFRAEIAPERLGYSLQAFIDVKLRPDAAADRFEQLLARSIGVLEWTLLTGTWDFMLRVVCADQQALVGLIEALRLSGQVAETQSRIILRSERRPIMAPGPHDLSAT